MHTVFKRCVLLLSIWSISPIWVFATLDIQTPYQLADEMTKETPVASIQKDRWLRQQIAENDILIEKKFQSLSIDEKNTVLKRIRQKDARASNGDGIEFEAMFSKIAGFAKQDNKALSDITSAEFTKYIVDANIQIPSALLYCPYQYFPSWNNYADPIWGTSYQWWLTSNVASDPNWEWLCDYQVWYNVSKSRVWGTTWRARTVLWNNGVFKRTVYWADSILIWWRAIFLYGGGVFDNLHREIVIW